MKINLIKPKLILITLCLQLLAVGQSFAFPCWGVGGVSGYFNNQYNTSMFKIGGIPGCLQPGHYAVWDFGDGTPLVQGDSVVHTYASPGDYIGQVKVYNGAEVDSQIIGAAVQCPIGVGLMSAPGNPSCTFQVLDPNNCISPSSTFLWNFGDSVNVYHTGGSQISHTYPSPGLYSVWLNATGTMAAMSNSFIVNSGFVTTGKIESAPGVCLNGGSTVEIFGIDDNYYKSFSIPDTGIQTCDFSLIAPFNKPVVIRATPWLTDTYLPTYYGNQVYWSEATVIQPNTNLSNLNIQMQTASGGGAGGGTISGLVTGNGTMVSTPFNNTTITTTFQANRSHAILLNSSNQPIAFAFVAMDGTFSFPNIADGQYGLWIEHPKVNSTSFPVVLDAGHPNVSVLASATSTGIDMVTENSKRIKAREMVVVPNPAQHNITFSGATGLVSVLNMQGKVVLETTDSQVNIESLPDGLYTLKALSPKQEISTGRFIKN